MDTQSAFEPLNDLERGLSAAIGEGRRSDVLAITLGHQIVVLLDRPPDSPDSDNPRLRPLAIRMNVDEPALAYDALAAFTDLERTRDIVEKNPDYKYALQIDSQWILENMPDGLGLAVNPGWRVGYAVHPGGLKGFRSVRSPAPDILEASHAATDSPTSESSPAGSPPPKKLSCWRRLLRWLSGY